MQMNGLQLSELFNYTSKHTQGPMSLDKARVCFTWKFLYFANGPLENNLITNEDQYLKSRIYSRYSFK